MSDPAHEFEEMVVDSLEISVFSGNGQAPFRRGEKLSVEIVRYLEAGASPAVLCREEFEVRRFSINDGDQICLELQRPGE